MAGPWSAEPPVGVAAGYANPGLLIEAKPETHAALFFDVPVNYDLETTHFAVIPRIRYSDTTGYSACGGRRRRI